MRPPKQFRRFTVAGVCLFLLAAVFGDKGLLKLIQLNHLEEGFESSIREMNRTNQELAFEIQHLKDPDHLERIIRMELNMIRPDEVVFIFSE